jgi:protein-L-isoaspartate(D-aspartate) O-methyltransferase
MRRRRRPLRGRWWVPRVWSWRSTSTPQRSPSPGENLERAGHTDLVLVHGDGGLGYPAHAPYDAICIAAACPDVTPPLIEQLAARGRLIAPVLEDTRQRLTLLEKTVDGVRRTILTDVLYVSLRGRYGAGSDAHA